MSWDILRFKTGGEGNTIYFPSDAVIGVIQDDEVTAYIDDAIVVAVLQDDEVTAFVDEESSVVVVEEKIEINTII